MFFHSLSYQLIKTLLSKLNPLSLLYGLEVLLGESFDVFITSSGLRPAPSPVARIWATLACLAKSRGCTINHN